MAKNADYWRKRAEMLEDQKNQQAGKLTAEVERQFQLAEKTIDEQIEQWYGRFAKNNQISLADAQQWLTGKDLAEFKWDVTDYIKYGKEMQIDPALMKQLENASARYHVSKLEALKMKTLMTAEKLYGQTGTQLTSAFEKMYTSGYYHTIYEMQQAFGIGWDIGSVNAKAVESLLSKPWTLDGKTFSERLWTDKQKLIDEVHTQLTQTLMLGASPDRAIKAIQAKFNTSRSNAARLVHTEASYFMNAAQKTAYETLDVEEFEIVGTLDGRTCAECGSFDGQHVPMKDFEAGVTAPPFHARCRCCTAPYFEDEANYEGERFARDEDGKAYYVPQDMTYKDWKAKFVDGKDKDGLKPVVDLKNPPQPVIINMGSLEQPLGTVHADKMREILENSPENAREVWNKYADRLQVENAHYKGGAHCGNNGISLDIDKVAQGRTYMGEVADNPYYTAYHEFGHNIDRIVYRERGDYRSLADTFRSSIHLNNDGLGYTLTEMLNAEGTQRVNDVWARLKKEAIAAGGKASDVRKFKAYAEITLELIGKSVISTADVMQKNNVGGNGTTEAK